MTVDDAPEPGLTELFQQVGRGLRRSFVSALAPWDISPHQARALMVVRRHGTPRLGDVAQHLRIAPRSATEVVDGLEQRGLLAREPDPADRRATCVALTDAGARLLDDVDRARRVDADAYFAVLDERRREQLRTLLLDLDAAHRTDP